MDTSVDVTPLGYVAGGLTVAILFTRRGKGF